MEVTSIYVLPTEIGHPPRALLGQHEASDFDSHLGPPEEGAVATWSSDIGCWTLGGAPIPAELGDIITEHAKSLGVKW